MFICTEATDVNDQREHNRRQTQTTRQHLPKGLSPVALSLFTRLRPLPASVRFCTKSQTQPGLASIALFRKFIHKQAQHPSKFPWKISKELNPSFYSIYSQNLSNHQGGLCSEMTLKYVLRKAADEIQEEMINPFTEKKKKVELRSRKKQKKIIWLVSRNFCLNKDDIISSF